MTTLDDLATLPRWCAWRAEARNGRTTKLPLRVDGAPARVNDIADWVPRAEATEAAKRLVNGSGGGIGVLLGPIDEELILAGIDLDSCRERNGELAPWARDALAALGPTYAEISPSGGGTKAFFLVRACDLAATRKAVGLAKGQDGRKWAATGVGDHAPAVEAYLGRRWFAVTDHIVSTTDRLAIVTAEALAQVRVVAERAFAMPHPPRLAPSAQNRSEPQPSELPRSRDESRSARAFRLAARMKSEGGSFSDFLAALHADDDLREWAETKGAALDGRELRRAWDRAPAASEEISEDACAVAFAAEFQGSFLYDHSRGRWLRWIGTHWAYAETPEVFHEIREFARAFARKFQKAKASRRANFYAAVERLVAADPVFARHEAQFDRDPMLLATPAGTIDLRSGELRPARRGDLITQVAGAAPAPRADCPTWLRFLHDVALGDGDVVAYLQRCAGYVLSGDTSEHVLWFAHGPGGNGKSVFTNTLRALLGDYARVTPFETLAAGARGRHPTEIAFLRGGRLVIVSETDEAQAWNESRIKSLTGADPITARYLYRDYFTFVPTFKVLVVGNHVPKLANVDDAIRRRLHLIPFIFKPANPDFELEQKLRAELPGIMRWAIDGALAWQAQRLAPPRAVTDATERYLGEQDVFGAWAAERLDFIETAAERPSALLCDFHAWAARVGETPRSRTAFAAWVDRHPKLSRRMREGERWVVGCTLKRDRREDWR